MTRVLSESFEAGHFLRFGGGTNGAITTSSPIDGLRSYGSTSGSNVVFFMPSAVSEMYAGEFYKFGTISASTLYLFEWIKDGTELGSVRVNRTLACLEVYRGALGSETLIASSANGILSGFTTYHFQFHIKIDDAVGVVEIKKDDALIVSFTGDTKPGTDTTFNRVAFWQVGNGEQFDDLTINTTAGSVDNSWPGILRFQRKLPVGPGFYVNNWARNTGSSNWECVDEVPPDNDTTYIFTSTPNIYESFSMSDQNLSSVNYKALITACVTKKDSGTVQLAVGIRDLDNSTNYFGVNSALGTSYGVVEERRTVDPSTGVTWTSGGINAQQALIDSTTG